MFGSKHLFSLMAAVGLGSTGMIQAAQVIKIAKNNKYMAISKEKTTEIKVGQRVCVENKNTEKFCGKVIKLKYGGAIVRMNTPLIGVIVGDKVQFVRTAQPQSPSLGSTQQSKKIFPFLTASLMNWQYQAQITNDVNSVQFNGNSLGLGVGGGAEFRMGLLSWGVQGQALIGNADVGFLKDAVPNFNVDASGQGLGYFGARIDNSILMNLNEGVCWGFGIPLMTIFYFQRNLGQGTTLKSQDFIQWGFVLDFRLKRNRSVYNPKMGFSRNLKQYFISIEYQWTL
ncbi:MAG: hypothetical protein FJ116_02435 [Deltaproteobacteria bacterium]|nr:hypothetical protein [Deltaproteobacteria bacterium]